MILTKEAKKDMKKYSRSWKIIEWVEKIQHSKKVDIKPWVGKAKHLPNLY